MGLKLVPLLPRGVEYTGFAMTSGVLNFESSQGLRLTVVSA